MVIGSIHVTLRLTWIWIRALPSTSQVTLSKSLDLSVPPFPQLRNEAVVVMHLAQDLNTQ